MDDKKCANCEHMDTDYICVEIGLKVSGIGCCSEYLPKAVPMRDSYTPPAEDKVIKMCESYQLVGCTYYTPTRNSNCKYRYLVDGPDHVYVCIHPSHYEVVE